MADVNRLADGLAYALARAALPDDVETSHQYAERLAPLVVESGYLAELNNVLLLSWAIDKHTLAYGPTEPIHDEGTCTTDCAGDILARYRQEVAAAAERPVAPTSVGKP